VRSIRAISRVFVSLKSETEETALYLRILCLIALGAPLLLVASGPGDRQVTDPKSIVSPYNPSARPVPIGDLYFTRAAYWPSWSPDDR
jgi:hypothetical protein